MIMIDVVHMYPGPCKDLSPFLFSVAKKPAIVSHVDRDDFNSRSYNITATGEVQSRGRLLMWLIRQIESIGRHKIEESL